MIHCCPVYYRMFSSILRLHTLDASSSPAVVITEKKFLETLPNVLWGTKLPLMRSTDLYSGTDWLLNVTSSPFLFGLNIPYVLFISKLVLNLKTYGTWHIGYKRDTPSDFLRASHRWSPWFQVIISLPVYVLLQELSKGKPQALGTCNLGVVLNSSAWGVCDFMHTM